MERERYLQRIQEQFEVHTVCGILGPRQCGKTTLALEYARKYPGKVHHFDLENPDDLESLMNPMRALETLTGLVIIDEIQRLPNLFPILRVLVDRQQAHYLVLGSASRELIRQSSETLAGRIGYIELTPFHLREGCVVNQLLSRGGYPVSYTAKSDRASMLWRESYIQTFLEKDIPSLGFSIPPLTLRRCWQMLTHVHGQQLNLHEIGTSLGISGHTVRTYLDILEGTFMVRVLQPWHENISKRQTKTPKLYFRDSGILLALMKISSYEHLLRHPSLGAVWEGFAMEQVIQAYEAQRNDVYFWRTANGSELDLLVHHQGKRLGFEFKFSDAPKKSKSMMVALNDLKLDHLSVVYPGKRTYSMSDELSCVSIEDVPGLLDFER
jgi:predicted AAA+ superfamily ATPase